MRVCTYTYSVKDNLVAKITKETQGSICDDAEGRRGRWTYSDQRCLFPEPGGALRKLNTLLPGWGDVCVSVPVLFMKRSLKMFSFVKVANIAEIMHVYGLSAGLSLGKRWAVMTSVFLQVVNSLEAETGGEDTKQPTKDTCNRDPLWSLLQWPWSLAIN